MINKALLDPEVLKFIRENLKKDIPEFILKGSPFKDVSIQELATQLKGFKIASKKFPEFHKTEGIIYPPSLNLEQTSSEITAKYKASIIDGKLGIDITGGLGIDSYFLSKKFDEFIYCEVNTELAEIAEHNFSQLEAENIRVNAENGLSVLETSDTKFDWLYCDPARRDSAGGKLFKLADCEPDIPSSLDLIFEHTDNVMIKTSPVLDITAGIKEMNFVKEIYIIAVKNEVKELLWILKKGHKQEPEIKTVNFEKTGLQEFPFNNDSYGTKAIISEPGKYLYEPNAAIMKSGLFDVLAFETGTQKLHEHTHLYTSEGPVIFPGRSFEVTDIMKYGSSKLKKRLKYLKANITTRNFPDSVEKIRKRYKVKDGGDDYIFFTTDKNSYKIVIFCKKLST